jgi:protein-disulfide isomerase
MIQLTRRVGALVRLRRSAISIPLCLSLFGLLGSACQKKAPADANAGSSVASAATAAAGQPEPSACDQFVTKLCGRTGDKSALCTSGKSLGKVLPASACLAGIADFQQMDQQIAAEGKVCTELTERLCKDLGPTTETCQLVRDQTPQFPKEQCEQLTKEYDQVLGELKQKEAMNQPLSSEVQARIAAKGAPSFGPEDAKVTIVEFSDFQCPYCSRAAEVVHQIKNKYGDKVRFVFRQFPLPMHQQAHLAAQAAVAAQQQGKFWEYHDLLFANQRELTRESLEAYAKKVDMNMTELKRALDGQTNKAAVDADVSLGEGVSVSGTPTVFINGKRVPNPTEFAPVAKLIDEALGV